MDPVNEPINNQPTQQPLHTPAQPPLLSTQPKPSPDYFERLFSGRLNRKNFIIAYLITSLPGIVLTLFKIYIALSAPYLVGLSYDTKPILPLLDNNFVNIYKFVNNPVLQIVNLVFAAFSVSLIIRRLHDIGKTGWFILLAFIPFLNIIFVLYLLFTKGKPEDNIYGEAPSSKKNIIKDIFCLS